MPLTAPTPEAWKRQTFETMMRSDREVLTALKQAQADINRALTAIEFKTGASDNVRRAQLQLAKRNIQARMSVLWRKVGDITEARRLESANRMIKLGEQLDQFLLARAGYEFAEQTAQNFAESMQKTAESGLDRFEQRVNGGSYKPLSDRVYNSSTAINGQLDRLVNSALAQALSAREFAASVRNFINPGTPGGVPYAAMRLSRTEINNAAHAVAIQQQQDKPWVTGFKWHLSGSHPKTDICNSIAGGGLKRDGVYEKGNVPAKPHPLCFCSVTPETPDEEEFLASLLDGHYNPYLERYRDLQPGQIISSTGREVKPPRSRTATAKTDPSARVSTEDFETRLGRAKQEADALAQVKRSATLSEDERRAFYEYGGFRYSEINRVKRGLGRALELEPGDIPVTTVIGRMDRAFRQNSLAEDVQIWRGGRFTQNFIGDRASSNLTGFSWEEKAYTSTSARQRQAEIFGTGEQSFLMRILAPKGTPALALSGMDTEAEILLGPKHKFRVVRDRGVDARGRRLLDVEILR